LPVTDERWFAVRLNPDGDFIGSIALPSRRHRSQGPEPAAEEFGGRETWAREGPQYKEFASWHVVR
jgi:hypothetical protein